MTTEELRESLLAAPKNGYATLTVEDRAAMEDYCKRYAAFMDTCKTEREAPLGPWPRLKRTASSPSAPTWMPSPATRST